MKRVLINYSLEIFSAVVILLTLVNTLFFPSLSLVRKLVNGFALTAILHEFEEKRTPGGFYELVEKTLGVKTSETDLPLAATYVMIYWTVVLTLSYIFPSVVVFCIMLIALGILEIFGHTMLIFAAHLGKPYSPGLISAWIMGGMSIYSILQLHANHLASASQFVFGTILMLVGFIIMQRCILAHSNLSFGEFLKNVRRLVFGKK